MSRLTSALLAVASSFIAANAAAQDPPAPAASADQFVEATGEHADDDIRLVLTLGTALNYGNTRSLALNTAVAFALRRGHHAFAADGSWVLGVAAVRDPMNEFGDWDENSNNLNGRLRYDFFFTENDAFFAVLRARRDEFAGLDSRLTGQAGYLRNFFNKEGEHRFWGELGIDITYDNFDPETVLDPDSMENHRVVPSARLFFGYDYHVNEVLTYLMGLETLMAIDEPAHMRFEWVHQLRSKVVGFLEIGLDVTLRLDSKPPGQVDPWDEQDGQAVQMFDILTTLNAVGTFDLDGEVAAPAGG